LFITTSTTWQEREFEEQFWMMTGKLLSVLLTVLSLDTCQHDSATLWAASRAILLLSGMSSMTLFNESAPYSTYTFHLKSGVEHFFCINLYHVFWCHQEF
jgi:Na+/H+ antiporter NhaD/arsenite permease-like protein